MAKRTLCMLLALTALFSLCAPAFAEDGIAEEPAATEEPVVTEEPAAEPTEEPIETEAPAEEVPEEPAATEEPVEEAPAEPAATEESAEEIPEEPVVTEVPVEEAPEEPTVTEVPAEEPEAPAAPAPEAVEEPEPADVVATPEPVEKPNSGKCGDNIEWSLSEGTLTLTGVGPTWSYYMVPGQPWNYEQVYTVVVGEGVTSIGGGLFENCTNLTSVTLPSTLTSIGEQAFMDLANLTSVNIPAGVTSIGGGAFEGCKSLTSVTLPEGLKGLGGEVGVGSGGAFAGCTGLTSVNIPASVTSMGAFDFNGCTGLKSVTLADGLTAIGTYMFGGCTGLTSVKIPASVTAIGTAAFQGCTGLTSVTLPSGVKTVGNGAFAGCTGLTSATISSTVTSIGVGAFSCDNLAQATILSKDCVIDDSSFLKGTVICGYAGSTAQAYAEKQGNPFKAIEKPAQPKVSKVTTTAEGVTVTWNAVENAETYTVYYKTGTGKWKKLADTSETSYTWSAAKSGTKYSFSVQAQNAVGVSGYNKTGKSTTYMAQPKVKSAKIDASGVKITWAKVKGATKYQVMYKVGDGNWKVLAKSATGTSYTWKKVKSGTSYTFSVRAVAKDGSKGVYDETGKSLTYVAAPKVKSVKKVSGGIKITWAKVNGAAKYQVMYRIGNGKWKALTTTDKRTFTWKKAKNGTKYTFSVRAVAADGTKGVYNTTGKTLTYKK